MREKRGQGRKLETKTGVRDKKRGNGNALFLPGTFKGCARCIADGGKGTWQHESALAAEADCCFGN